MKKVILIIGLIMFYWNSFAQGIKFEQNLTWREIKIKARHENKYIFINAYTTWSAECKALDTSVLSQKSVGDLVNQKFIAVKIQINKTDRDKDNVKRWYVDAVVIAKENNITTFPTILFFSPDGRLVHQSLGYKSPEAILAEAAIALDPKKQFYALLEVYEKGGLNPAELMKLAYQADAIAEKVTAKKIADNYISKLTDIDITSKANLYFIGKFLLSSTDRNFKLFYKQPARVDSIVGRKNYAESVVMSVIYHEEIEPYEKADKPDWQTIYNKIYTKFGKLGEERLYGSMLVYYASKEDWLNFGKYYKLYFDRAIPNDRSFVHINNLSWPVVENISDSTILKTAVATMKYDVEKNSKNDPAALDTYANLLYKIGNIPDAIAVEEEAVKLSKNGKVFIDTLEKMKRGEKLFK